MTKEIPDNLPCFLSGRSVPLGLNVPNNRYPLPIACCSDTTDVHVWFYELRGLYWYSVTVGSGSTFNSIPFVSIQNCISAFRGFLRDFDFRLLDQELANKRLAHFCSQHFPKSSEV